MTRRRSNAIPIRVKRFSDGSYALSAVNRERGQFTLVEGSKSRARIVHVNDKKWKESLAGAVLFPSGLGTRTVAFVGDDESATGKSVTLYRTCTVREDNVQITSGVRRSASWVFRDGRPARGSLG